MPWKWLLLPSFVLAQWVASLQLKRRWRPDIVHAHWLLPQGVVATGAGLAPLVVTSHGADLFALKGALFKQLRSAVVARAAAITVVSGAMRARLCEECPGTPVLTLPMGVDLDGRFALNDEVQRSANTILFVGRLVEKKGLIYLIEAMPQVRSSHPEVHLDIVGFGPERDRLAERVRQLGVESSVRFVGAVPQAELSRYYQSATVFVAPFIEAAGGDQEGLGLVVAEALGCGCPVVVGDVPAVHDLIGGAVECVVPQRDADALAKAVIRVMDDPVSAGRRALILRERMQERFSWVSVTDRYADLFESLIASSQPSHE